MSEWSKKKINKSPPHPIISPALYWLYRYALENPCGPHKPMVYRFVFLLPHSCKKQQLREPSVGKFNTLRKNIFSVSLMPLWALGGIHSSIRDVEIKVTLIFIILRYIVSHPFDNWKVIGAEYRLKFLRKYYLWHANHFQFSLYLILVVSPLWIGERHLPLVS